MIKKKGLKMSLQEVEFFGAVDRKDGRPDGRICSEYPAFYFDTHIRDMEEEVARKERALDAGMISPAHVASQRAEVKQERERLDAIKKSSVNLTGKTKDEAVKVYKDLEGKIGDSMFTRTDMEKGLADAHEELRRQKVPRIDVKGYTKLFHNMGIPITKGKASRDQCAKVYKILGKALGENTNTERLRKDTHGGTYREDVPMHRV